MKIRFKDAVQTEGGVIYPAGYTVPCDTLTNLPNGHTTIGVIEVLRPGLIVTEPIMTIAQRDLPKLEVILDTPTSV